MSRGFTRRFWLYLIIWVGCTFGLSQDDAIHITLLQVNDVYEMAPISGQGGLARVASLKKQLLKENPNTFAFLAGDLVSPSAIGLAKIDGERIAGKQMIESINPFLDFMTFGNHEFDIKEDQLKARIAESKFKWISSNVFQKNGAPFDGVASNAVFEARTGSNSVRVGVFSVTINSAGAEWVTYDMDLEKVVRDQIAILKQEKKADIIIGLTHLDYPRDVALAESIPEIDLIMGGHEHENMQLYRGLDFTPVFKADANARTAYIHRLTWRSGKLEIASQLRVIDSSLPDDPETAIIVKKWLDIATESFRKEGIDIGARVAIPTENLDGRESTIRNEPSLLTDILAQGMVDISGAQAAIFNGGSIRIDDQILAGQAISEYDVLRILPFGGQVALMNMKGDLLKKTLNQGLANKGKGGYLQWANITHKDSQWRLQGKLIEDEKSYKIALTDFLTTGKEEGLAYLKSPGPGLEILNKKAGDIRKALSDRLKKEFP